MRRVGKPSISIAGLEAAIARAEKLDDKAERSADDQDFEAASVAWGQAALVAHMFGTDAAASKVDRDAAYKLGVELNKVSTERKRQADEIRTEAYRSKGSKWSARDTLTATGKPPTSINVLDQHGGFTAETKPGHSLWRPGSVLKETRGALIDFDKNSFFQTNNDATKARYRAPGYRYPVLVWFDNKTGVRIA